MTSQEPTPQERARGWLLAQAEPLRRHTGGGRIDVDQPYDHDYEGVMQGGFGLGEVATPPTRVVVFSPDPIPPGHTGPISIAVWNARPDEAFRIEAYLLSDEYYWQGTATASGDGTWRIDAVGRAGEWRFRLFDAVSGQQVGEEWRQEINPAYTVRYRDPVTPVEVTSPDPIPPAYEGRVAGRTRGAGVMTGAGYHLKGYLLTDAYYPQFDVAVVGGGPWEFDALGFGGEWRFRLFDDATGSQIGEEWNPSLNRGEKYPAFPSVVPIVVLETPVVVTSPDPIPQYYYGDITGSVRDFHLYSGRRLVVQAYLRTDKYYFQAEAGVDEQGRWSVDAGGRPGEWRFRLLDYDANEQLGIEWRPGIDGTAVYQNVVLRLYTVTDAEYMVGEALARDDHRWSLFTEGGSQKLLRLVNTATGHEYARWTHGNGLLRSYALAPDDVASGTSFEHRGTTYDQAVAVLAFLQAGDLTTATRLGTALAGIAHYNGAFPFSFHQIARIGGDPYYRSGAVAWGAYALTRLTGALAASAPREIESAARHALDYLLNLQDAETGLVRGGSGRYAADDTFYPDYTVGWYSTEHNIDAWFAFRAAGEMFDVPAYKAAAARIRRGLRRWCWDEANGRFWQGLGADRTPDGQGALDVHSWGALLLHAWGMAGRASRALSRADSVYRLADPATGVKGYKPYTPAEGYPGAAETVWLEGSFGVLLAKLRTGAAGAAELSAGLESLQEAGGGFPYATVRDARYEITDRLSVASTGWYLLADAAAILWTERDTAPRRVLATAAPFYADPFGKQDSTRRVQRAVGRAAENLKEGFEEDTLHLPPGVYRCTATITIPRDVSVTGAEGETILDFSELGSGPTLQWGPAAAGSQEGTVTGVRVRLPDGSEGPPAI